MAVLTRGPIAVNISHQVTTHISDAATLAPCEDITPLPEPKWGDDTTPVEFPSLTTFEFFTQELHVILEAELESQPYNTFGSFLKFYEAFQNQAAPFWEFYKDYEASIIPESLSCVGLSCHLLNSLISLLGCRYPELKSALFLASSEEVVLDIESYCNASPPSPTYVVKEHVLLAMRIVVEGRPGFVILDSGYHVNVPVVVMSDGLYPHTGWFVLSETVKVKKEYNYLMKGDYVQWVVKETRKENVKIWNNLVYVGRKFLSHVSVSEKRNLVFNFRTLVARDRKQPVAGLYCNFEGDKVFTLFFKDNVSERNEVKIPFEYFQNSKQNNQYQSAITSCALQLGYNATLLTNIMVQMIEAFYDSSFMPYVREVNRIVDEE